MSIAGDHQRQRLLFFISDDVDDALVDRVARLFDRLASLRAWVIAPPGFVDETDEPENPAVDLPVRTVGGVLELYSSKDLAPDLDRRHYDEVADVLTALAEFSEESGHEWEVELDGAHVGSISNGKLDRLLTEGLLAEWRTAMGEEKAP